MRPFFADALHIFIIFMMAAFLIGGILALTGTFDHWGSRYVLKRRRRRLLRNRVNAERKAEEVQNSTPYHAPKPERKPASRSGYNERPGPDSSHPKS